MSDDPVYYWRVTCTGGHTESQYTWSKTKPTVCPTNTSHSINVTNDPPTIKDSISKHLTTINEGTLTETGRFNLSTVAFDCATGAGSITSFSKSWNYKVSALKFSFSTEEKHRGDKITMIINENTTAGVLLTDSVIPTSYTTQNYTTGDAVIYNGKTYTCHEDTISNDLPTDTAHWTRGLRLHVTSTVIDNINHGYHVRLTDGVNVDDLGEIWVIDTANSYIYVENKNTISRSYLATSPSYVQIGYYMVGDSQSEYEIGPPWYRYFGSDKIGGSDLETGTVVTIHYTNSDGASGKRFIGEVEILRGEHTTV